MAASVSTNDLKPKNVTSDKLADDAVTAAHIAAGAVGTTELADDSVTAAKIATDAVGASEIAAGAVGSSELASDAVTTVKILDANVTMAKLAGAPAGELGGTWPAPTVNATHSGSAHHAHSGSNNAASASPTMTTALTIYDITGASVSLAAGTWLLIGNGEIQMAGATGTAILYIRTGSTNIASLNQGGIPVGQDASLTVFAVVTPGSTTTYKMSATANQNGCTFVTANLTAVKLA